MCVECAVDVDDELLCRGQCAEEAQRIHERAQSSDQNAASDEAISRQRWFLSLQFSLFVIAIGVVFVVASLVSFDLFGLIFGGVFFLFGLTRLIMVLRIRRFKRLPEQTTAEDTPQK